MLEIRYEDEYGSVKIGEILTNRSMTTDEALDLLEIDLQEWAHDQGWEAADPNCVVLK